jgi:hypothetical protein
LPRARAMPASATLHRSVSLCQHTEMLKGIV